MVSTSSTTTQSFGRSNNARRLYIRKYGVCNVCYRHDCREAAILPVYIVCTLRPKISIFALLSGGLICRIWSLLVEGGTSIVKIGLLASRLSTSVKVIGFHRPTLRIISSEFYNAGSAQETRMMILSEAGKFWWQVHFVIRLYIILTMWWVDRTKEIPYQYCTSLGKSAIKN